MNFAVMLTDFFVTIISGIILAFLFFLAREKIFPLPKITGRWYFEVHTEKTTYQPYKNMRLRYVAMLWREGKSVKGTVEKIYENSSTGKREFIGKNRTRGEIDGYIDKNYLGKDRLYLHVVEEGHGRESTNFYDLVAESGEIMSGNFTSMVADQEGVTNWQRKEF